uniref:Uncharacterized protein n=1 Tax=Rhizophora mucronata TaxID=61149 RepID=A0A2P2NYN0_RHIMU
MHVHLCLLHSLSTHAQTSNLVHLSIHLTAVHKYAYE